MFNYLEKILTAPVYDVAIESPLSDMPRLSDSLGHTVLCKREDLQPVFSFKCRGAYNKMYHLNETERTQGVICSSAGNHAQGVALAACKLNIKATIVMPTTTPAIKIDAVRRLGKEWVDIILHGDIYDEASQKAHELMNKYNLVYIHPFDDPYTIAGQGTIGLEILRQHPRDIDAIFVPIGGGGILAGISVIIKSLRPNIKVIGVEPEDAASMTYSVREGKCISLDRVGIFADGVAVKKPGQLTYELIKQHVDEFVTVTTDEICVAMKDIFDDTRVIAEPSGAVATAGLKKWANSKTDGKLNLISVISGANVNFDRLRFVVEHAEYEAQLEGLIAVTLPEKPSAYVEFYKVLDDESIINELTYRYQKGQESQLFLGVELKRGREQLTALIDKLNTNGYVTEDLTDNEIAKEHLRYMLIGTSNISKEYIFNFHRKLCDVMHLFEILDDRFNLSLLHYSSRGAIGEERVLCGFQTNDYEALIRYLAGSGYKEETNNPAYQRMLSKKSTMKE